MEGVVDWVEDEFMERCSHALTVDGRTWLIDPVDNPLVDELENVAGVIQLLDRHNRDCAAIAARLDVPHHVVPHGGIPPFAVIGVRDSRRWHEVALWWEERRLLVCAEALGTAAYYRGGGERLAVHPLMRLRPPSFSVRPDVILCGHGPAVYADATAALHEALSTSRRRIPRQVVSAVRAWRRRPTSR
ncbi:MAG: hypothetical protein ACJ74M_04005 [Gaiellaceae bacterium]